MNTLREIPIISSDAGDASALQNPNSPASIIKKARDQEVQSAADMKYDATAPARLEAFQNCVVEWEAPSNAHEITHSLFLASAALLLLYAAAPEGIKLNIA
jgi:hypothetical protein